MQSSVKSTEASSQPQKARKSNNNRALLGLGGLSKTQFETWQVGANYKCEKILGVGSYGQVAEAI